MPAPRPLLITLPDISLHTASNPPAHFKDNTPSLRLILLQGVRWLPSDDFASLTHLWLSQMLLGGDFPERLLKLIPRCPRLQNLTLRDIRVPQFPQDAVPPNYELKLAERIRPRRLSLINNDPLFTSFILSHVAQDQNGPFIQVYPMTRADARKLLHSFPNPVVRIRVSWSAGLDIAIISSHSAMRVRIGRSTNGIRDWITDTLEGLRRPASLELEELWIGDIPPDRYFEPSTYRAYSLGDLILLSIGAGMRWARYLHRLVVIDKRRTGPAEYLRAIAHSWQGHAFGTNAVTVGHMRLVYTRGFPGIMSDHWREMAEYYDREVANWGAVRAVEIMFPSDLPLKVDGSSMWMVKERFRFRIFQFDEVPRMEIPDAYTDPEARPTPLESMDLPPTERYF